MIPKDESDFLTPARQGLHEAQFADLMKLLRQAFAAIGKTWPLSEWKDPDQHEATDNDRLYAQEIPQSPLSIGFYFVDAKGEYSDTETHIVIDIATPTPGSRWEPPGMDVSELAVLPCRGRSDIANAAVEAVAHWARWSADAHLEAAMESEAFDEG